MIYSLSPATKPIDLSFHIPGSKSYTNRALIAAAIAPGVSKLSNCSLSDDSRALIEALRLVGIEVEECGNELTVYGGSFGEFSGVIDIGPAGTTARFLTALLACLPGIEVELRGSERMHQRPIAPLVEALTQIGADIEYIGNKGCPPLLIKGKSLSGGTVSLEGSVSSQYFSALMLSAPLLTSGLSIKVVGEQISKSYIDMTVSLMKCFGVDVVNDAYQSYGISKQSYSSVHYRVEGDASGASYPWGLAAVSGGKVRVYGVSFESAQGDAQFPRLLEEMGCKIASGSDDDGAWIEVKGCEELQAITTDMVNMPDTAQTLSIIASVAKGVTTITGLETLTHKETDRISALQTELRKLGIRSNTSSSHIAIVGGEPKGARIATYEDHRMAMSFALLGSCIHGIEIEDPAVVNKSFPSYWDFLSSTGITITEVDD